jgi:outer membrane biogenesis lipoprotein LolB
MRTFARAFVLAVPLLLVTGCATQAERAAQVQREVEQMIELYGPGCEKLGYRADTDQWRECVLKLAHRDDRYNRYPISTNCIGHRGFVQCTTF